MRRASWTAFLVASVALMGACIPLGETALGASSLLVNLGAKKVTIQPLERSPHVLPRRPFSE